MQHLAYARPEVLDIRMGFQVPGFQNHHKRKHRSTEKLVRQTIMSATPAAHQPTPWPVAHPHPLPNCCVRGLAHHPWQVCSESPAVVQGSVYTAGTAILFFKSMGYANDDVIRCALLIQRAGCDPLPPVCTCTGLEQALTESTTDCC